MCNKMECLQINLYMDAHVIVFQLPYIPMDKNERYYMICND